MPHIDIDQCPYPVCTELIHVVPRDERTHRPANEDHIFKVSLFDEAMEIAGVLGDRVPEIFIQMTDPLFFVDTLVVGGA